MTGGSRSYHSKSRNGCAQCKKRHVRCDLRSPSCRNCERRGDLCEYRGVVGAQPTNTVMVVTHKTPPLHDLIHQRNRQIATEGFCLRNSVQTPSLGAEQAHLLHIYSVLTAESFVFASRYAVRRMWQYDVLHESLSHSFLLSCITSISALHASRLYPADYDHYQEMAHTHHATALALFRSSVREVNTSNASAVFAFSFIVAFFQISISSGAGQSTQSLESIIAVLTALRGSWSIAKNFRHALNEGFMGLLLKHKEIIVPRELDEDTERAFRNLMALNQSWTHSYAEKLIYEEAITELVWSYKLMNTTPIKWNQVILWPARISQEYFERFRQGRQMALIIFVFWCAPLYHAPSRWFLDGWVERSTKIVMARLDGPSKEAVAWPLKDLNIDKY